MGVVDRLLSENLEAAPVVASLLGRVGMGVSQRLSALLHQHGHSELALEYHNQLWGKHA